MTTKLGGDRATMGKIPPYLEQIDSNIEMNLMYSNIVLV